MDVNRELEKLKPIIRSLIMSHPKRTMAVTDLERDFVNTEGYRIPFVRLGYPSVYHLLCCMKDTVHVYTQNGVAKVSYVSTPAVAHVERLIQNTSSSRGKRKHNVRFKENVRQQTTHVFLSMEPVKQVFERTVLNDLKKTLLKASEQAAKPKVCVTSPWGVNNYAGNNGSNAWSTEKAMKGASTTPAAPTAKKEVTQPSAVKTAPTAQLVATAKTVPTTQVAPATKIVPTTEVGPTMKTVPTTQEATATKTVRTTQIAPTTKTVPCTEVAPTTKTVITTSKTVPTTQVALTKKTVPTTQVAPTTTAVPTTQAAPYLKEVLPPTITMEETCEHVYGRTSSPNRYADLLDWLNMLDMPSEVMGVQHTIPKADLNTYFAERELRNVRILHMLNPNRLWLRSVAQDTVIERLYDELNECYNHIQTERWCLEPSKVKHGLYCAVLYSEVWERGRIVGPLTGNQVKVHLIDTGLVEIVNYQQLKYLSIAFSSVPAQAFRASLACLIPKGSVWTRAESDRLTKLIDFVSEQPAYILNINTKTKVLNIFLKRKNGDWLNERFATLTSAQWTGQSYLSKHPDEFRKKRPTYNEKYPSFFCIEEGHFPVMVELRNSLKRGLDYEELYSRIPHTMKNDVVDQITRTTGEKLFEIFDLKVVSEEEVKQIMQERAKTLPEKGIEQLL